MVRPRPGALTQAGPCAGDLRVLPRSRPCVPIPSGRRARGFVPLRVVAINLNGTFYTIRAAVPLMKASGSGSIVNFASVAGLIGLPMPAYYPASKAAVVGLTKAVAAELAPFDIRVNALAPAGIRTAMLTASGDDHVQALLALQPLKRLAEPEEIGRTVLFLASDAAGHYTGQTLAPSGGALML